MLSIATLHSTPITVGMREVNATRKSWRDHPDHKKADFLGKHLIPVIGGFQIPTLAVNNPASLNIRSSMRRER
jgi:hypothetical protein